MLIPIADSQSLFHAAKYAAGLEYVKQFFAKSVVDD
jgi:hypothetical protein